MASNDDGGRDHRRYDDQSYKKDHSTSKKACSDSKNKSSTSKERSRAPSSQRTLLPKVPTSQIPPLATAGDSPRTSDYQRPSLPSINSLDLGRSDRNTTSDPRGPALPPISSSTFNNAGEDRQGYNSYFNEAPYPQPHREPSRGSYTSYPRSNTPYSSEPRRNENQNTNHSSQGFGTASYGNRQRQPSDNPYPSSSSLEALVRTKRDRSSPDDINHSRTTVDGSSDSERRRQLPSNPTSSFAGDASGSSIPANPGASKKMRPATPDSANVGVGGGQPLLRGWLESLLPRQRYHEVLLYNALSQSDARLAQDEDLLEHELAQELMAAYETVAQEHNTTFEEIAETHMNDRFQVGTITRAEYLRYRSRMIEQGRKQEKEERRKKRLQAKAEEVVNPKKGHKVVQPPPYDYRCTRPGAPRANCGHPNCMFQAKPVR